MLNLNEHGWDVEYSEYLINKFHLGTHGVLVECGANDGMFQSVGAFLENTAGWKCINIECNPHCFKKLQDNRPNCLNLHYALDCQEGTMDFIYPVSGQRKELSAVGFMSDILNEEYKEMKLRGWRDIKIVPVVTKSLELIARQYKIEYIDLMILDVEGKEFEAMMGMNEIRPTYMAVENKLCDKGLVEKSMTVMGYKKVDEFRWNSIFALKEE